SSISSWRRRCRSSRASSSILAPGPRRPEIVARWSLAERLEVAALRLLPLDRLGQRLEIADAEAARAVALDDLEEERRAVLDGPGEDLEEVALLVAVGLDPTRPPGS